jgi:transcription initiation factor TFIID subunit 1, fungi type
MVSCYPLDMLAEYWLRVLSSVFMLQSSSMDDDAAERYGKDKARSFDMILLSDWESRVIYDADRPPSPKRARPNALTPYNVELEKEDWIRAIAWDGTKRADFSQLTEIEEEDENAAERLAAEAGQQADKTMFGSKKEIADLDMYNISNDHHYEGGKHRVRQTFGTINVQHAYPALKLQLPFVRAAAFPTLSNRHDAYSNFPL